MFSFPFNESAFKSLNVYFDKSEMVLGCWCTEIFDKLDVLGSKNKFASSSISLFFLRTFNFRSNAAVVFFLGDKFFKAALHSNKKRNIIKSKLETYSNNILYLLHSHRFRHLHHRRYRRQHGFALWT